MDVPLALTDIEVQQGLEGFTRRSSTFCRQTGVVGLSAFSDLDLSLLPHNMYTDRFNYLLCSIN